ncbi:MAG: hypothetical protein AAGM22_31940 [Acidobacteriota bacterium]
MIIWTGWGILTPLIVACTMIFTQLSVEAIWGEGAYQAMAWAQPTGAIAGGVLAFFIGSWLNRKTHLVLNERTGDGFTVEGSHTIFWIKMEYWALLWIGLMILLEVS